jgi:hypothetical protein
LFAADVAPIVFSFRTRNSGQTRQHALRALYRSFSDENTPEAHGRRLLCEWLSAEQRAQLERHRYFEVIGCDSNKRYRIHYGTNSNVHEIDETGRQGWDGAFYQRATLSRATTCWRKRLPLKPARTRHCPWPTGFRRPGDPSEFWLGLKLLRGTFLAAADSIIPTRRKKHCCHAPPDCDEFHSRQVDLIAEATGQWIWSQ